MQGVGTGEFSASSVQLLTSALLTATHYLRGDNIGTGGFRYFHPQEPFIVSYAERGLFQVPGRPHICK
jgi:hypothetical protein